jgi:ubiquinone/menaquinone biosynthesis methyltransferases
MNGPKTQNIQSLFDSIAGDYDRLNHLLSLGVDKTWRRRSLKQIVCSDTPQQILDIACGTGDFSIAIARKSHPETIVTGLDLSEGMLTVMEEKVASARNLSGKILAEQGNSEQMRFGDGTFDRVTIAFGIRNFEHREMALKEILRVLKPGGRLVILELSTPTMPVVRGCYNLYFTKLLPLIGGAISGDKAAYRYLPASVLKFPGKEEWMATMAGCGYCSVTHKAFTFGICRMYTGEKPQE